MCIPTLMSTWADWFDWIRWVGRHHTAGKVCLSQGRGCDSGSLWGYLAHKGPNCTTCLSPRLASHQPYLFSQNKPHGQTPVVSQGGSSTHSQGKRSKYLPNGNSQSKGIMTGKLSTCPEDRIILHVCKYM